jgi:hypothetical protein
LSTLRLYSVRYFAEATPEAGHHAIIRRWPIEDIHAVLASTDGSTALR